MNSEARVRIAYGKGHVSLALDPKLAEWRVIRSAHRPALAQPREAFEVACRVPAGSPPLRDIVKPTDRVVIVTSDGTRAFPNRQVLPWLLTELAVPSKNITILVGTGSHRANTQDELLDIFGPDICRGVRIVNHDAFDTRQNIEAGRTRAGAPILLDAAYVHADRRIVLGFIEPHFFAGFSGGPKGVIPGVAGIETIFHVHSYALIADPRSTWGNLNGNPLHEAIAEMVAVCPPDVLINVALNDEKEITNIFAGHYLEAHRAGCAYVREIAMAPVPHAFPVVVTSNSGYPLDQNLYQSVKGMSAAARITEEDGAIFMASECCDGIPAHGNFAELLQQHDSLEAADAWLRETNKPVLDQWQVQMLAQILRRCRVSLYSALDPACARRCKMSPIGSLETSLREHIETVGRGVPVAVLPEGPLTIPYIAG